MVQVSYSKRTFKKVTYTWVTKVSPEDLSQIVNLHKDALKESFMNNFGPGFLSTLYKTLAGSPKNHLLLVKSHGKVAGFLLVVSNVKSHILSLVTADLIIRLFLKPILAFRIFQYLIQTKTAVAEFELQFIAVNKAFRNQGIGTKMLKNLAKKLTNKPYLVGTKKNNQGANAFYRKNGFIFSHETSIFGDVFNYYTSARIKR